MLSKNLECFIQGGGKWDRAEAIAKARGFRTKAAISSTTTDDLRGDFATVVEGEFLESLASGPGVFDTLRPFTRKAALRSPVAVAAGPLTGSVVPEGGQAPVSKFSLDASALEPRKAMALAVISNTALASPFGPENLSVELKNAVILATDGALISLISEAADTIESASADVVEDLQGLLEGVVQTGHEKLFWVCSPGTATILSTMRAAEGGALLFPQMSATGGTLLGVTCLVSAAAQDSLLLLDASALCTADDSVQISLSDQAPLSMVGEPSSSDDPETLVSLFQADSTGVLAVRHFGVKLARTSGAATLTGVSAAWGQEE